jgi:(p)ppGpp synthase/HD superfamily hydrolase
MSEIWSPDKAMEACLFAARAHQGQTVPGGELPYLVHLSLVSQEVMTAVATAGGGYDADLAAQCAWLHDTVEDTAVTHAQLTEQFGAAVADGVLALTKDSALPKSERMADSLRRIQRQPREIWLVKLADRIVNLQPPPAHWSAAKAGAYLNEALLIHAALQEANPFLADRLLAKTAAYRNLLQGLG